MFQLPFVSRKTHDALIDENRAQCRQINALLMDRIKINVVKPLGRPLGSKNKAKAKKK